MNMQGQRYSLEHRPKSGSEADWKVTRVSDDVQGLVQQLDAIQDHHAQQALRVVDRSTGTVIEQRD